MRRPSRRGAAAVDVLQVITSNDRRGAEVAAVTLEPELQARGFTTRTVALAGGGSPTPLPVPLLGPSALDRRTLVALRRELSTAAVAIAHGSRTLPATAIAGLGSRTPFVYRNIGDPYYWTTTLPRRARTALFLSRAAAVASLTDETADRLAGHYRFPRRRITTIPIGVSTSEFPLRTGTDQDRAKERLGVDPTTLLAVCVGSLSPEKNVVGAVEAMKLLPDRWRLVIAGDGPERGAIERAAAPITDRVTLVGQVTDPVRILTAADLLVLSSDTEGLPGVVAEAAMVGVPAVATDVGFIADLIDDPATGRIVAPRDPQAIAEAVLDAEPSLLAMGKAANERLAGPYSLASTADRWHDLLAPFVEAGRHGG